MGERQQQKCYLFESLINLCVYLMLTRQVSSMIHSAKPTVTPEANIVFCCFVFLDVKSLGRTYGQHVRKQLSLPAEHLVVRVDQFMHNYCDDSEIFS